VIHLIKYVYLCVWRWKEKYLFGRMSTSTPPPPNSMDLQCLLTLVYSCWTLIWVFWEQSCSWKIQLWVLAGLSRAEQLTFEIKILVLIRVLLVFKQRGHNLTPVLTSLHQLSTLILDFSKNPSFPQSIFLHLVISVNKSSALIFPVNIKIEKYIQSIQHCLYSLYSDFQCSYT
jgi:hypothetical protein